MRSGSTPCRTPVHASTISIPARTVAPTRRAQTHKRSSITASATSESVGTTKQVASPSSVDAKAKPMPAWSSNLMKLSNKKKTKETIYMQDGKEDLDYLFEMSEEGIDDLVDGEKPKKRLPAEMRCFDSARIYIRSGDGGNGCVAFRREKCVEFGGPNGANGGKGGNVWAIVDPDANSLFRFRGKAHWRAKFGIAGQGSQLIGANAPDLFIPVPPGTIIRLKGAGEGEAPLAELLKDGDKALLLVGGRGGRGNESFKTSLNNAPAIAENGEKGKEAWVDLELKVVADVGIIGIPNAGKSTLLAVLTSAKPKIANYPFTTLVPNLGVCEQDYRTTVFADVPGLLEGAHEGLGLGHEFLRHVQRCRAHEGLGLGHEFLRHVQRCRALVHVIDGTSPDPMGDFNAINLELELFNPELKDKPQVVAYNKIDVPDSGDYADIMREDLIAQGIPDEHIFAISAVTGKGVIDIVRAVRKLLDSMGPAEQPKTTNALNMIALPPREDIRIDDFTLEMEEDGTGKKSFYVEGVAISKFAQMINWDYYESVKRFQKMTNWDYYESVKRFQKVLDGSGINGALKARGVQQGDNVVIAGSEFEWQDDQSTGALYDAYIADMRARGQVAKGSSHWPKADLRADDKKNKK
eukprot:gene270-4016_t